MSKSAGLIVIRTSFHEKCPLKAKVVVQANLARFVEENHLTVCWRCLTVASDRGENSTHGDMVARGAIFRRNKNSNSNDRDCTHTRSSNINNRWYSSFNTIGQYPAYHSFLGQLRALSAQRTDFYPTPTHPISNPSLQPSILSATPTKKQPLRPNPITTILPQCSQIRHNRLKSMSQPSCNKLSWNSDTYWE